MVPVTVSGNLQIQIWKILLSSIMAAVLAVAPSVHGYSAPHACKACKTRCTTLVASESDAARAAWLSKLVPVLRIPDKFATFAGPIANTQHGLISLEDTFDTEFADCFHLSPAFRSDMIGCASDVGSLFSRKTPLAEQTPVFDEEGCLRRVGDMLERHLGKAAPTADEFVGAFSSLCGDGFRWGSFTCFEGQKAAGEMGLDTYFERQLPDGALDWHQDWAAAEMAHMFGASRTVMLAFPAAGSASGLSAHEGTGLLTELIKLTHEFSSETLKLTTSSYRGLATSEVDRKAAAGLGVAEEHTVRPYYCRGREILRYKDSEHLHRSPRSNSDPAGRTRQAIWRFQ